MLCVELARFINDEVKNITQIPAMAGLADRIKNPEVMEAYFHIAAKEGYTKELLSEIATVIDFVSAKLRFMEAREYIEVLFGEPRNQQKDLVSLLSPYIRQMEAKGLEIARASAKKERIGKSTLQILDIESTFSRGFYPKPGKCTGILHDDAQKESPQLVTIGVMTDAITIRATDAAGFSVHKLIEYLHKHLPSAFVGGGGHKNAGSITFVPNKKEDVMKLFREYIKNETDA